MYDLGLVPEVSAAIAALPAVGLRALAEVFAVLEVAPWSGLPYNDGNPDGAMRHLVFGPGGSGEIVYVILENSRRVEAVSLVWLGDWN